MLGWVSLTRVVLYCRLRTSLVGKISGMASEAHSPQSSRRTECHFLGWLGGDVELSDMHCALLVMKHTVVEHCATYVYMQNALPLSY